MTIFPPLEKIEDICIPAEAALRDAIACIDRNQRGIALVANEDRRLVGTITDGDVRRAMLTGADLSSPVSQMLAAKQSSPYVRPVTARIGTDVAILLRMMREFAVRQIPLLDSEERVAGLVAIEEFLPEESLPMQAVIMAGGLGSRLMPLTEETPKPMLPVGDRPLMERIIEQLRQSGIHRVNIATHYQREKIKSHFGDGRRLGVDLVYVDEDQPLGTAGALALMQKPTEPLLVINGDILTQIDFRAMLQFHREQRGELTVAVRKYEIAVPYGVVECDEKGVRRLTEKPKISVLVNAGIYLLDPSVHAFIPSGEPFNMTDLIQRLLEAGRPVVSFPVHEYWLDIGVHADYAKAQEFARQATEE